MVIFGPLLTINPCIHSFLEFWIVMIVMLVLWVWSLKLKFFIFLRSSRFCWWKSFIGLLDLHELPLQFKAIKCTFVFRWWFWYHNQVRCFILVWYHQNIEEWIILLWWLGGDKWYSFVNNFLGALWPLVSWSCIICPGVGPFVRTAMWIRNLPNKQFSMIIWLCHFMTTYLLMVCKTTCLIRPV